LQALLEAQSLEEINAGLLDACERLNALDIFSNVDVLVDKSADVREPSVPQRRTAR